MATQLVSLLQMRNTVRRMTARYTPQSMTDSQIDNYINLFYTLHFPEQFRTLKLNKPYVFTTIPNIDTYAFAYQNGVATTPSSDPDVPNDVPGNVQIDPPVFCQGYRLNYFQDKSTFYNRWPKLSVNQQINQGDGTGGPYIGTIASAPFLRAQVDIFDNVTESAVIISTSNDSGTSIAITDDPNIGSNTGNLIDEAGNIIGEINYLTGDYEFSLNGVTIIEEGDIIYASVVPYQAARPIDVIFTNQQLTFRPVPIGVFQIEFQVSQTPAQLIADESAPELDEWYLFICSGAAKLIYTDFPDPEGMQSIMPVFQEQLQLAQRRTLRQMGNQRVQTIFTDRSRNINGFFWGSESSGGY